MCTRSSSNGRKSQGWRKRHKIDIIAYCWTTLLKRNAPTFLTFLINPLNCQKISVTGQPGWNLNSSFSPINRLLNLEKTSILRRHRKKLEQLVSVKKTIDGLETNPNETILNLSGEELSEEQIDILKMGLRHGLATHPNKLDMMSISEDLWDQLDRLNQFKDGYFVKEKVKNSLRSFTYNYIDLDLKQFYVDRKRIRILKNMNISFAILKPDKGNGIVILKRSDYIGSVSSIFDNPQKFTKLYSHSTSTRLHSLQTYLSTLF